MQQGVIWGERVGLRPLRPSDAGELRRMMADPEVAHLLFEELGGELPPSLYWACLIAMNRLTGRPDFGIVEREGGRLVGRVSLWRISERNGTAMLTIFVGVKERWGHGYGTEALRLLLKHGFHTMGLHRVELNVFAFNERAIRSYEKVGFSREGERREALLRQGRRYDVLVMGILRDQFAARELERSGADSPSIKGESQP